MDLLAQLDLLGVKSPYSFGLLIYAFSIQNFENLLQKMTFSYCYIGYICHTFQIALLQTSMIFGGLGAVELRFGPSFGPSVSPYSLWTTAI